MKYFITGFRPDSGWDNAGEEIDEVFETKKQAEEFIKGLLNRGKDRFTPSQITVIHGEVVNFVTNEKIVEKVEINETK